MGKQVIQLEPPLGSTRGKLGSAIEIRDLCKTFGKHQAVDRLSLCVEQGEIFGLLGPNGSGKTTILNLLCGLSVPDSGTIHILDYTLPRHGRVVRRLFGVVPQETGLYEELSAWENLDFHADLFGVPLREKRQRIASMLELVQLQGHKDGRVRTYCCGMKRRLALARALLHDPLLIFLDEPTLGVDALSRRTIWDYILELRKRGKTVLVTTNSLEEAQALCDRLAIIEEGRLVLVDTLKHLRQRYGASVLEVKMQHTFSAPGALQAIEGVEDVAVRGNDLRIRLREGYNVSEVIQALAHLGTIKGVLLREVQLEEIFLQLTEAAPQG